MSDESDTPATPTVPSERASAPVRPAIWLTSLLICQDAFRDDRGRTHLHGVTDGFTAPGFPIPLQFMVWCCARGRGTARLVLRVQDTLEQTVAVTEAMIADVTPFKAHEFFCGFNVQITGAGLYRVSAYLDGIPAGDVPLMVRLAPPSGTAQ